MTQERIPDVQKSKVTKAKAAQAPEPRRAGGSDLRAAGIASLQQQVGNRTVQRLIAQRSGDGPTELDDGTADRIDRARGGGQSLDTAFQAQAGEAMGHDFGGVRVHTSREADDLSQQLGAKAFTTGQDIFFREGAYDPHASGGQELISHELTHVVQQSSGSVGSGGGRMQVNEPGDAFEQEADAVAEAITGSGAEAQVQRQAEEDEEALQMQPVEEEEEEAVQMQAAEEEDAALQMQAVEEEEEEVAA